jgi:hypothetical protein
MKHSVAVIAFSALVAASCKEKEENCRAVANKAPCYVAFKGFNPAVLHTVIQYRYRKGSSFSQRLSTDTIYYPNVIMAGDTAFSSGRTHMGTLFYDADYELVIPAASKVFRITDIAYAADSVVQWTESGGCSQRSAFTAQPLTLTIDGNRQPTADLTGTGRWIVLK